MILVVLLFLLPVGCTVEDESGTTTTTAATTTTGGDTITTTVTTTEAQQTTTTTQVTYQGKLVTLDFEKYSNPYYARNAFSIQNGEIFYDSELSLARQDTAKVDSQFRVLVEMNWAPESSKQETYENLLEKLHDCGVRVESYTGKGSFFAQGTKEQLESMVTLEPNRGYYLWLAPPWRPEGYSSVYSDVMAAWLEEAEDTDKVWAYIYPSWDMYSYRFLFDSSAKTISASGLENEDRLFTQEQLRDLLNSGQIRDRMQAIGERYRGEHIGIQCQIPSAPEGYPYNGVFTAEQTIPQASADTKITIHAFISCVVTKEELLKMADDPEIRCVDIYAPASWRD